MTTRELIAIAIFAATLIGKLLFDRHRHFSRKVINHKGEAVIVAIALVAASWMAGWVSIWTCFDTGFGLLIARDPLFLGTSSELDRAQAKYRWLQVLKYVSALTSIILFIWLR